jgi:hypothetical protein
MALETKIFCTFGRKYRTKQFAAIPALKLMKAEVTHPTELLKYTEIYDDGWHLLEDRDAINEYIIDVTDSVAPQLVLRCVLNIVSDHNFGFLVTWKGTKVPSQFCSESKYVRSQHVEPMVTHLIQDGSATMRELEEYYSLQDAYKLFDIGVVKGVNSAYAHEAAMKSSRP